MRLSLTIIAFVAFVLVSGWFKNGLILGYAEGALPFYDIGRYLLQTEFAWGDHPGLGSVTGIITAAGPSYFLLSKLQQFGVPGYLLQEITFFLVLFSSGVGIYLLTKLLSPSLSEKYLLLAVFFYWFNPISLVNIWNRFLLNYIVFWGFLPLALYIFVKGIKEKKYLYVPIFVLLTVLFSYCFSSFVFVLLTWLILLITSIFFGIIEPKNRKFFLLYFILTAIFFVLSNSWWIGQFIEFTFTKTFQTNIPRFFSTAENLGTLDALSKKTGNLIDVLMFRNASFFTSSALDWVKLYLLPISIFLTVVNILPIFLTMFKARKIKFVLFLSVAFLITVFLMQGTNPPFGVFYYLVFKKITFLQVFRNPFEKFGFLLPLFAAPLYGMGVGMLSKKNFLYIFFFAATLFFWGLPFFTGHVFTTSETPNYKVGYQVKVPDYYVQANRFLAEFHEARIIEFPIADQGITFNWEKGYNGVDLPSTLFDKPVISFNTTVPFFTDIVPALEGQLAEPNRFLKIANLLNVRFVITREDIDFEKRKLTDPKKIKKLLEVMEKSGDIKIIRDFKKLKIWEIVNYKDKRFYAANNIIASSSAKLSDINLNVFDNYSVIDSENSTLPFMDRVKQRNPPVITYTKINPTKYKINLEGGNGPFVLVFSELFNPNWELSDKGVVNNNHFRVNIFANGWLVDTSGNGGLVLEFTPQSGLELGKKLSMMTIFLLMFYICLTKFVKRG